MHEHTRDCPLTCLKSLLSAAAYNPLRSECLFICGDAEPVIGHAVRLYAKGQLADIRNIGPVRFAEITTCLAGAGLSDDGGNEARPGALQAEAAAGAGPPALPGWPAATSSRLRTRLILE